MPNTIATAVSNPVLVRAGRIRPSLFDTITKAVDGSVGGPAEDMSEATVKFSMRPLLSRAPVVDEEDARGFSLDTTTGFNVAYDWQEEDVEQEGQFMAWWTFTLPEGHPQDTPEFPITISDHGPGEGVPTGVIVANVGAEMPVTFDALRDDIRFGDRFMQGKADLVKYKVLGVSIPADQESTLHPLLLDYFSKRVALELIGPGVDYWSRQHKTVTTTGTSEIASYPDMIASLKMLDQRLRGECAQVWQEVQFIVANLPQRQVVHLPTSDMAGVRPLTPNPYRMPRLGRSLEGLGWDFALGTFPFP